MRGRDAEIAQAGQALGRTSTTGRGMVLLITGEAGIGKSALLDEVRRQALGQGYAAGNGKADEVGQISPGAPLLLALRSGPHPLLGRDDFAELAGLIPHPLLLVDRIGAQLERLAMTRSVLITVDDVQWADWLSLFALRILTSRLADLPVVWAFTSRDEGDQLVADLSVPGGPEIAVHPVRLGPLSPSDVTTLAQDRLGRAPSPSARRLLDGIRGNPFLALQIIDGLAQGDDNEQVPPMRFVLGVRRLLNAQPSSAQDLILAAAVLGRPFTLSEGIELMGGRPVPEVAAQVQEAVSSGLLADFGPAIGFKHDLVRETVYADLSEPLRRELHRRCARYLLRAGDRVMEAAQHARAMARIGDQEAIRILRRGADEALTALPRTAGDLILQAFRLTPVPDPAWLQIGEQAVSILGWVQRGPDALEVADRLLSSHRLTPDAEARIQVLAANALWLTGGLSEAAFRLEGALARPGVSAALRARLGSARALILSHAIPAIARPAARAALADARQTGDREALSVALRAAGESAKNSGQHTESLGYFTSLRHLAGVPYLAEEIVALQLLDRFDDAETMLRTAWLELGDGVDGPLPSLLEAQLWQDLNLGRLDAADAVGRTLLTLSREIGNDLHELTAVLLLFLTAYQRGDLREADRLLQPVKAGQVADVEVYSSTLAIGKGILKAAAGDWDEAVRLMTPPLSSAREAMTFWPWWPGWMQIFVAIGRAAGDRRFVDEAVALAEEGALRNPGVASFEGVALHVRGLAEQDPERLGRGCAVLRAGPRPILYARSAQDYGTVLIDRGRRVEGVALLNEAKDIFGEAGAMAALDLVHQTLQASGSRRAASTRPATGWEALTTTERTVADLVATGHSNRSAAVQLGMSPNTVGTHLRSIFVKLGISSRVQLTNVIHARSAST